MDADGWQAGCQKVDKSSANAWPARMQLASQRQGIRVQQERNHAPGRSLSRAGFDKRSA